MKIRLLLLFLLTALGITFQSCKKPRSNFVPKSELRILRIEDVLNGNDKKLSSLLNRVRGSVGRRGPGSKTIWSRKNYYSLGLYISANHVHNLAGWNSRNAQYFDLSTENLGIFETSQIPPVSGSFVLGSSQIADFPLMHFDISANASNATILPAEDFYLGVVDNQRREQGPLVMHPDFVQTKIPLQLYDPHNRTTANQTWNIPVEGEKAIAIGYPQDKINYPNGAVAYGNILSDIEALDVIRKLKSAGDIEGEIPYNSDVEFLIEAMALAGMSGGGVFNSDGQLLGIMVRASDKENAPKIIRVVKTSYIKSKMSTFHNRLSEADKNKITPFISGEL